MEKVTQDMLVGEVLQIDSGIIPILMESGMHCLGCPSSQMESLLDACEVHGLDVSPILDKINNYLENK